MTCEVAVMNKYALVIAADSAVTTSNGGSERYSKGGNKIFQLSRVEPVGVMIFGSAMLDGVPWEIVIKHFRETLGSGTHPTVQHYAAAFFDFLKNADLFFPQADRESKLFEQIVRIALNLLNEARQTFPMIDDTAQAVADRATAWNDFLETKKLWLASIALHGEIADGALPAAVEQVSDQVENYPAFTEYLAAENLAEVVSIPTLVEVACATFFKTFDQVLGRTGIVFSGFGEDQYFPSVVQYDVYGFVKNDFVYTKSLANSCDIGHNIPSGIFQFAMTSSIDTFTNGVGLDTYIEVNQAYKISARKLVADALLKNNIHEFPDTFDEMLASSTEEFTNEWFNKMLAVHKHPMKSVLASLPIQEMVHLAETLIVLQSLKERITTNSESVGGPVDIAVITKTEGLVWIKRKHYFEADKNLSYVMRQRAMYGEQR